ncbi:MAG: diguanylate cyclase [Smithella sp.]|nr:diguanylate cyclase [Smithella sp.]MDM7986657.1 diguanylate cyclase [Smithella sp.]HOU49663.1 diguanylate cyclase [Smithella sp.]HQG64485.1 diguanylate cyclase [Smithella sp.]HQH15724.1 diguanylate cyclase [Smithella sp.]
MQLHPVTLKFTGESSHLEEPFLEAYYKVSISQIRTFLILGAVLYLSFGVLDAMLMPEQKVSIWMIRFFVVGPALIGVLLISFSSQFKKYMQPVLALSYMIAGLGIVAMIVIAPPPVSYTYYAGLILVFMWGYTLIRLFFIWASLAGWMQVFLYEIAALWIHTPSTIFISNNFFFISANIVGMMACYAIEFYARRDFFMQQQLEIEKEHVNTINKELEERVRERTMDYQILNKALQQEVAAHKLAEQSLRASEERYRALVENASDMVFRTNHNGYFTFANVSTILMTGYEEDEIIGKRYIDIIHPSMREQAVKFFDNQFVKKIKNTYSEYPIIKKDGSEIWLGQNTQLIMEGGKITGFQAVSRDITERKRLEKDLKESEERYRQLSIMDDLTQLYNARHFHSQIKMEINRLERYDYPLTLLLLDIDDFKAFNDTYGHLEGDQVLMRLGQVIKRCLRKADSAYRYGGEEFTVILPMTTGQEGIVTAERIREELSKEDFTPVPDQIVHLTVSIGLSQYKQKESIKDFVSRVDQLMYQSKKNGKDQISVA